MQVRIYRAGKSAMQSGRACLKQWRIEAEPETARVPEPVMGWVSAEDTLNQIRLRFASVEEAIRHAERQGWDYTVDEAEERIVVPRSYMDNFRVRKSA